MSKKGVNPKSKLTVEFPPLIKDSVCYLLHHHRRTTLRPVCQDVAIGILACISNGCRHISSCTCSFKNRCNSLLAGVNVTVNQDIRIVFQINHTLDVEQATVCSFASYINSRALNIALFIICVTDIPCLCHVNYLIVQHGCSVYCKVVVYGKIVYTIIIICTGDLISKTISTDCFDSTVYYQVTLNCQISPNNFTSILCRYEA